MTFEDQTKEIVANAVYIARFGDKTARQRAEEALTALTALHQAEMTKAQVNEVRFPLDMWEFMTQQQIKEYLIARRTQLQTQLQSKEGIKD